MFEHERGVTRAVSGYAGGNVANPNYEQVSSGTTGHAESVRVTFDPAEAYHQDYLDLHPDQPYVAINDIPKVEALRTLFPGNWQPTLVKVGKLASTD